MDEKRRRRRPFGFFGFDEEFGFSEEFERMREEMEEIMERMMGSLSEEDVRRLSQRRGPQVYGFSVRVGPDGKPVVTEFGNVRRAPGKKGGEGEFGTREPEAESWGQETEEREPLVDVFRDKKGVNVIAELPGVEEKDIRISVGEKELEIMGEGARKYYRKVELPENVGRKKMEKRYRNGILEIVFS